MMHKATPFHNCVFANLPPSPADLLYKGFHHFLQLYWILMLEDIAYSIFRLSCEFGFSLPQVPCIVFFVITNTKSEVARYSFKGRQICLPPKRSNSQINDKDHAAAAIVRSFKGSSSIVQSDATAATIQQFTWIVFFSNSDKGNNPTINLARCSLIIVDESLSSINKTFLTAFISHTRHKIPSSPNADLAES
uniref:Uncharacterized protein n=1 Tax=Onchocerca volvulus TaxID=6282 RepID=A0A8R1TQC9_ONCVO